MAYAAVRAVWRRKPPSSLAASSARWSTIASSEAAGTIIVDTPHTYLYYVLGNDKAVRYGIGVGREGFTWSGARRFRARPNGRIGHRRRKWWSVKQPYLPRFMAGGPENPLGARAMYLGGTMFRIHGTNEPATIGGHVSSGWIRMVNEDVIDLYGRVNLGTQSDRAADGASG